MASLWWKLKQKLPSVEKEVRLFELRRKIFHCIGILFPILTLNVDPKILMQILCVIIIPMIILDYNNWLKYLIKIPKGSVLLHLLREHEMIYGQLCGLSWLFLGYFVVLAGCDRYLVAMAMAVLIFCDMMSALIGKNLGKINMCGKTLEGTLAYILTGFIVLIVFLRYFVPQDTFDGLYLIIAVVVSAFAELIAKSIHIDDNFAIPVSFCYTYQALMLAFG